MRRLAFRLYLLLRWADPRIIEFGNALLAVVWGTWLIMPWEAWSGSVIYRPLLHLAPEHVWGAVYAAIGATHVRVALSGSYRWRQVFSYVGVCKWSLVAALFISGQLHATATVVYGMVAVSSAWVVIRVGLLAKENGARK